MPDTLNDGGYIAGTLDIEIDGYAYTLKTSSHSLPVAESVASFGNGTFKGGAAVKQQEKLAVVIEGQTGLRPPSQLVPFRAAVNGFPPKNWKVTNLKIDANNSGAAITTWSADITQFKAALVPGVV